MSDQDSVQDVVQEGFLKVFNNIEGYTFKGFSKDAPHHGQHGN